ncbi:hypothetical protein AAC387_Pa01g2495 [Persea americana]
MTQTAEVGYSNKTSTIEISYGLSFCCLMHPKLVEDFQSARRRPDFFSKHHVFCTLLPKDYHCLDSGKFREGNEGRRWPPPLPIDLNFQYLLNGHRNLLANVLRYKKSIMLEGAFDSPTKFKPFFGNPNIDIVGLRPTTNGRQFFITYVKQPHLNGPSFIFGRVTHGFEVVELMEKDPWSHLLQRSG